MADRERVTRIVYANCMICGHEGMMSWSEGKGGTNLPKVLICTDCRSWY